MHPKNEYSPTIAQIKALYSVSRSEAISEEVMKAVQNDPDDVAGLKRIMENWNNAVKIGRLVDVSKMLTMPVLSQAICISEDLHQDMNMLDLRGNYLKLGLIMYSSEMLIEEIGSPKAL